MYIGKSYNPDICTPCEVYEQDEIVRTQDGKNHIEDKYIGVEDMKNVHEKKDLGDIICNDMKNITHIKERKKIRLFKL